MDRLGLGFLWYVVLVSTVMAATLNKGAPDLFPVAWVRKSLVDLETGFPIEAGMAATAALWFVFYSSFAAAVMRARASLWSLGAFTGACAGGAATADIRRWPGPRQIFLSLDRRQER